MVLFSVVLLVILQLRFVRLISLSSLADVGEFPHHVLVKNRETGGSCSGSLLNMRIVLTSAHCVLSGGEYERVKFARPKTIEVFAGTNDRTRREYSKRSRVTRIHIFRDHGINYGCTLEEGGTIALIVLQRDIQANGRTIQYVKLPLLFEHINLSKKSLKDIPLKFAGWGQKINEYISKDRKTYRWHTKPHRLRKGELKMISCAERELSLCESNRMCVGGIQKPSIGDQGGGIVLSNDTRTFLLGILVSIVPVQGQSKNTKNTRKLSKIISALPIHPLPNSKSAEWEEISEIKFGVFVDLRDITTRLWIEKKVGIEMKKVRWEKFVNLLLPFLVLGVGVVVSGLVLLAFLIIRSSKFKISKFGACSSQENDGI